MLAPRRCGWGAPGRAHIGEKGSISSGTPGPCRHPREEQALYTEKAGEQILHVAHPMQQFFSLV